MSQGQISGTDTVERRQDAEGKDSPPLVSSKFWRAEIDGAKKREDKWRKRATRVLARYNDEREDRNDGDERRANILWSNTEVLKSALFHGIDQPDVRRRFPGAGPDDRAARTAALVLERAAAYCQDLYNSDAPFEAAVEDMVLPARGQVWIDYDAQMDGDTIAGQDVKFTYVYWEDYLCSAGRAETQVWWRARRHHYSKDELDQYFPEHADKVPLNAVSETWSDDKGKAKVDDTFKRSTVWEIWDKTKRERVWLAEEYDWLLKKEPDPLKLSTFFPCPEPLYGHRVNSSLIPTPEYCFYQDQALELDQLATRLNRMIGSLVRRGVYDASMEGPDSQLSQLQRAGDNVFLPYKGMAAMMEKGGLKNVFQSEDLTPIIAVIEGLSAREQMLLAKIYDITGISDILRGSSNPNETATAQRIKGQFGSLRLVKRQKRVKDFIKAALRIKLEVIAEHFTRETLVEMTSIEMPTEMEIAAAKQQLEMMAQQARLAQQAAQQAQQPGPQPSPPGMPAAPSPLMPAPPQIDEAAKAKLEKIANSVSWEEIERILRSDKRRGYRIDVETDATAKLENDEDKQARIEFVSSMTSMLERSIPAIMQLPELAPLVKELIMFGMRAFKIGRTMEETFDDAFDQIMKRASAASQAGPQPDPKAEAEAEHTKAKTQAIMLKAQGDAQARQQQSQLDAFEMQQKAQAHAMDAQLKQADARAKAEADAVTTEMDRQAAEIKQAGVMVDLQAKAAKLNGIGSGMGPA